MTPQDISNFFIEKSGQYTFKERIVREFVRLTVEKTVADIHEYLGNKYDRLIYSEKIKYSNSKEYKRKQRQKNNDSADSMFESLGYWSAHNRNGASNAPHISSGQYEGRVFNGFVEGYVPSISEEDYINNEIQKLIDELTDNDIVRMIKSCLVNPAGWKEISQYNKFCSEYQNGCSTKISKQLEEVDALLNKSNENHRYVLTREGFFVYEDKIESIYRNVCNAELEQVKDYCEIDVLILESNVPKTAHIIVYSDIYPSQKCLIGLKKGDTFMLHGTSSTCKIQKIY